LSEGTVGRLAAATPTPGRATDFFALTKPRIVLLVMLTAAVGFFLGAPTGTGALLLLHTLVGTALVAGGTGALNQVAEWDVDARMRRTAQRPIPAGRLRRGPATVFAVGLGVGGMLYLAELVNPLTAVLAGITLVSYVFLYTPLKKLTSLNTCSCGNCRISSRLRGCIARIIALRVCTCSAWTIPTAA
jgi:protoheme IX farnesyltransferase